MSTNEKTMGQKAVDLATKGENKTIPSNVKFNWKEFGKFVGIWLLTATILFGALIIITIVSGSTDIFGDTIKEVDTLNMMFSLVLSALLEQIWSHDGDKGGLYNITLGFEGLLTILGGMLFMAYSIIEILQPANILLERAFWINLGYIIASTIVVILGFVSRSLK